MGRDHKQKLLAEATSYSLRFKAEAAGCDGETTETINSNRVVSAKSGKLNRDYEPRLCARMKYYRMVR